MLRQVNHPIGIDKWTSDIQTKCFRDQRRRDHLRTVKICRVAIW